MALLIAPILFIAVIIFVAYPFLTETQEKAVREQEATALEQAQKRKEDIIGNLKDIEMDFRMGKLSDEDYQALKQEQELKAIEALQEVENLEKSEKKRSKKKT